MNANTSGGWNTANGYDALGNNTSGDFNTANGEYALLLNTRGDYNTACGVHALYYNKSGNYNTAIGYYSGPASDDSNLVNTGAFGYNAVVSASNSIVLGNSSITSIGGYAAWSNLSDGRFKTNITHDVPGLEFIMKLNPVVFNWDIEKLDEFNGIHYDNLMIKIAAEEKSKRLQTGFIAQEVEQAAQECNYNFSAVIKPANENSHYNLSYAEFVVPIVKAIQEQQETIENLQKENQELKAEIAEIDIIRAELEELKSLIK